MTRVAFAIGVLALSLVGCSHAPDPAPKLATANHTKESKPEDPMEGEREGMHQGAFQLGNGVQDLQAALVAAKKLQNITKNADLKAALSDVIDRLDDAGASIADFSLEPPELDEFKKQRTELEKKAKDAVNGANDALHDIGDAQGILDDFGDKLSAEEGDLLAKVNDTLDAAADDLNLAIKGFGGKVEEDESQPVNPPVDPNDKSTAPPIPQGDSVRPDS